MSKETLIKNRSTRLRFAIYVIIANFAFGIFGVLFGVNLVSLGTFLSLSNAPLYIYILGRSYRGENGSVERLPPTSKPSYTRPLQNDEEEPII